VFSAVLGHYQAAAFIERICTAHMIECFEISLADFTCGCKTKPEETWQMWQWHRCCCKVLKAASVRLNYVANRKGISTSPRQKL